MTGIRTIRQRVSAAGRWDASRPSLRWLALPVALVLFATLLRDRLAALDPAAVLASIEAVTLPQWLLAACATAVSFWAVGQYDVTLHRHLRLGTKPDQAAAAGMAAIAVSQTLGAGLVTGALMRWRLLPGVSLWMATRLTLAVTLSFLCGWMVVTAAFVLLLPSEVPTDWAWIALIGLAALSLPGLFLPGLRLPGQTWRLPNGLILTRLLVFTALDLVMAALALHALCPPDAGLAFTQLLPAFALALGAGMVSGTPGGVGAFELTLLTLLPQLPTEPLLAAVLAFRGLYYAATALIGGAVALRGPAQRQTSPPWPADPELAFHAPRAEALLIRQGALDLLPTPAGTWTVGRCPHLLVAMHDPLDRPAHPSTFSALADAARAESRWPALYKAGARSAAQARRAGWHVVPVSREARLSPAEFDLGQPSRATLRRKLRKAAAAGVEVTAPPHLPLDDMARLSADWAAARGGERGFSMGRFCPDYVLGQRVYLAHVSGRLVGFASFHAGLREWTLDLVRHSDGAPDGTMQALVMAALRDAAALNVPRLSLAAVPEGAFGDAAACLPRSVVRLSAAEGAGLMQFKRGFDPHWHQLYLCAPNRLLAGLAAVEIARAIRHPPPLERAATQDAALWAFSR